MSTTTQTKTPRSAATSTSEPQPKRKKPAPPTNPIDATTRLSQCFKTISTSLYLSLAPAFNNNPYVGVKRQHLDSLVMKYYAPVHGVVIAYDNLKLDTDSREGVHLAKIENSSPFTFFWITVDLLVWSPRVGDVLEGDVYMQTPSHLGVLIHDIFNASIKKHHVPTDWKFVAAALDEMDGESDGDRGRFGHWVDSLGNRVDEAKVRFTVKRVYTTGRVVSVEGSLIQPGEARDDGPVYREKVESSGGKHKKFEDDDDENAGDGVGASADQVVDVRVNEDEQSELPEGLVVNDANEDEDYKIVNNSDSVEDEVESD
ncbi:uncharacterized protein LODBEIA_P10310 [Lodderomyces beijingensis]|uniref:DNA-directed RNA polymerase subunit n=1 Tax=Lodderomyces beijingensis TaxID=1775926 RepID=A0ABP0ZF71_9ASCO